MPARTALLITIGDVIETGPPTTRRSSAASSNHSASSGQLRTKTNSKLLRTVTNGLSNKRNLHRSPSLSKSHHSDEEDSEVSSYTTSEEQPDLDLLEDDLEVDLKKPTRQMRSNGKAKPGRGQTNGFSNGRVSRTRLNSQTIDVSDFVDADEIFEDANGVEHDSDDDGEEEEDSEDEDQPLSPRTRSSVRKDSLNGLRANSGEFDEEVSFSDPLALSNTEGEDDEDGDGRVRRGNKRDTDSKSEPGGTSRIVANGINHNKEAPRKQRHRSETWETSNGTSSSSSKSRKTRVSSTNGVSSSKVNLGSRDESPLLPGKKLRVDLERLKVRSKVKSKTNGDEEDDEADDGDESDLEDEEEEEVTRVSRSRKSTRNSTSVSNSSRSKKVSSSSRGQDSPSPRRKKRSELDKLLDAGSSSFHFETAAQEKAREVAEKISSPVTTPSNGLGPIHVDVSESNSSEDVKETLLRKRRSLRSNEEEENTETEEDEESESEEDSSEEEEDEDGPPAKRGRRGRSSVKKSPSKAKGQSKVKGKRKGSKSEVTDGRRRKKRRLLVTREELMEGPAFVGSKDEPNKKRSDLLSRRRGSKDPTLADYVPLERFEELDARLAEVSPTEVDVEGMSFSFEKTPFNEGWFQTYSRQDQCDEILYFPDTSCFPLPYEMPITTFYPRKDNSKAAKVKSEDPTPSTSSTRKGRKVDVEDLTPKSLRRLAAANSESTSTRRKGSKASSTDSESAIAALKAARATNILARLGPRTPLSISLTNQEWARKSPRCHASTKALLHGGNSPEEGNDLQLEDGDLKAELMDECSNDSTFSNFSSTASNSKTVKSKVVCESQEEFNRLAGDLDLVLRAGDPDLWDEDLGGEPLDDDRPSSLQQKAKKKLRRSSGKERHKSSHSKKSSENPMDRTVACNVDPVLLDCLEDELPSVTLDEEVPGSSPLELIAGYETCKAISFGGHKWKKRLLSLTAPTDSPYTFPTNKRRSEKHVLPSKSKVGGSIPPPPQNVLNNLPSDSSDSDSEAEEPVVVKDKLRRPLNQKGIMAAKKLARAKQLVNKSKKLGRRRKVEDSEDDEKGQLLAPGQLPKMPRSMVKKIIIPKKSTLRKRELAAAKAARKAAKREERKKVAGNSNSSSSVAKAKKAAVGVKKDLNQNKSASSTAKASKSSEKSPLRKKRGLRSADVKGTRNSRSKRQTR